MKKCRYLLLKTIYFLLLFCFTVTLATAFLSSVTVENVPERLLIKGKMGIQGTEDCTSSFLRTVKLQFKV